MKKAKLFTVLLASFTMALVGCGDSGNTGTDTVHVTGVSLSTTSLSLNVGDNATLVATVSPSDASDKTVTWSTSSSSVASVDNGIVTANAAGTADIIVTTLDGYYTDTCHVSVSAPETRTIKGYIFDEKSLIDGNPYQEIDQEYVEVTTKGIEDDVPYYVFNYNVNVRFKLKEVGSVKPTGLKVDDTVYNIDENNYITFKAHVDDESDFYLSIHVLYVDDTPVTGDYVFNVTESDHISLEFYDETKKQKLNGSNQGDIVYIKPISSSEDYDVHKIVITYYTSDIGSKNTIEATKDGDYYRFTTPYAYNKTLNIVVTEVNNNLLKGYALVGTYLVINKATYTSNHVYNSFESNTLSIATSGAITYGKFFNQLVSATAKTGRGTAHDNDHYSDFIYDDNFFFARANSDYLTAPFSSSFDIVGVKMKDKTETSDYELHSELIVLDKEYFVITVYFQNSLYASCVIDYTSKEAYFNTKLNMYTGTKITDAKAMYDMTYNDNKVVSVSYQNEGGISERIALGDKCGVFSGEQGDLIVPNEASAIYESSNYVLTISENTFTLSNADYIVTLTADFVNKTYVFVSKEDNTSSIPSFKGLTFKGTVYSSWEEDDVAVWVQFDEYDGDNISGVIRHGPNQFPEHKFWFTATYDIGTNVITLTITEELYKEGAVGHTCQATCAEGKMTFTSNFSTNGAYVIKGLVATCSDFHL